MATQNPSSNSAGGGSGANGNQSDPAEDLESIKETMGDVARMLSELTQMATRFTSAGVAGLAVGAGGGNVPQTLQAILQVLRSSAIGAPAGISSGRSAGIPGVGGAGGGGIGGIATGVLQGVPGVLNSLQQFQGLMQGSGSFQGLTAGMTGFGSKLGPVVGMLAGAADALKSFISGTHQANMALRSVSPSIAGIAAMSDLQDQLRLMQRGEFLAQPAGNLSENIQGFKSNIEPIIRSFQFIATDASAKVVGGLNELIDSVEAVTKIDWSKVGEAVLTGNWNAVSRLIGEGVERAKDNNKPADPGLWVNFLNDVQAGEVRGSKKDRADRRRREGF